MILEERVRDALASSTRFSDIRLLDVTDSTNREVLDLAAAGAPEGLVVAADLQTAGRGRLDRTWEAETGAALLVTVLLRPVDLAPQSWHLLTAATGLAAQDACSEVAGVSTDLKWPNDLLVDGSKLAGILAEAAGGAVAVGMGLNVHSGPPGSATLDGAAGRRVRRSDLLAAWLRRLDALLGDWDRVKVLYAERCATVGRRVHVDLASGAFVEGIAEGIDDEGRLLVRPDGEAPLAVAVGDVTHLRSPKGTW